MSHSQGQDEVFLAYPGSWKNRQKKLATFFANFRRLIARKTAICTTFLEKFHQKYSLNFLVTLSILLRFFFFLYGQNRLAEITPNPFEIRCFLPKRVAFLPGLPENSSGVPQLSIWAYQNESV